MLEQNRDPGVRVFVVWEPVLPTDFAAPSTSTLARITDHRASQYWDKSHLVSRMLGEHDRKSVVWDYIAVYPPGTSWQQRPPDPAYSGNPVIKSIDAARDQVQRLLAAH